MAWLEDLGPPRPETYWAAAVTIGFPSSIDARSANPQRVSTISTFSIFDGFPRPVPA